VVNEMQRGMIDAINSANNDADSGNNTIKAVTKESNVPPGINTSTSDVVNTGTKDADMPPHNNTKMNNAINITTKDANAVPHVNSGARDAIIHQRCHNQC
jgi:hypothetical protein